MCCGGFCPDCRHNKIRTWYTRICSINKGKCKTSIEKTRISVSYTHLDVYKRHVQGIESIALSQGSILNSWIRELSIKQADGTEKSSYLLMLYSDAKDVYKRQIVKTVKW